MKKILFFTRALNNKEEKNLVLMMVDLCKMKLIQ